jgi:Leucine-rich repeat (LRR) protein
LYGVSHRCEVKIADLSKKSIGASFTISQSPENKERITWLTFHGIGKIDHLPSSLFHGFPKLSELLLRFSLIPILRDDFFKQEVKEIRELMLISDGIKIVEENAFALLTNLETIDFYGNELQSLSGKIFQSNHKLRSVGLMVNKIKMIQPEIFENLKQLEWINLNGNKCLNQLVGCWNCNTKLEHSQLNLLQSCYANHQKSFDLLKEGEFF